MSQPLISVAMAVCNVDRFLAQSIESILEQTFRDFEFIIVDFGSTDNSRSIAVKYATRDSRIRIHEIPNCPLPEARNAGCFLAQGRYIAVMDADDVSLPQRLEWEVDFMEKHPEVGLLGGAVDWIDEVGRFLCRNHFPTEDREIRSELVTHYPFCHPTVMVRKDAFVSVGGYRTAFAFSHDYDLSLRLMETYQCANLDLVVLKYRIHTSQVTLRNQRVQTLCKLAAQVSALSRRSGEPDPLDAVREITPTLLSDWGIGAAAQQNALASNCRNWIRSMLMAQEYPAALKAGTAFLQSDRQYVARWQIADLNLTMARLYWKQGKRFRSLLALGRALATRPLVIGRPLTVLVRRLGLVIAHWRSRVESN